MSVYVWWTLNMHTAGLSEILVPIEQNTRCHLSRDRKHHRHHNRIPSLTSK